jgi:hypothetical protein
MPTPVGPLGPDEVDPNDPDLWDWEPVDEPSRRQPRWIRFTAWSIAAIFAVVVIINVIR